MKIVISPAKTLDFNSKLPIATCSEAQFLKEAKQVHTVLKKKSPTELTKLMEISSNLANLNWERNQQWQLPFSPENARQAVFAFNGEVYSGLDAYSLSVDKIVDLQDRLLILSGLYGLLKPLDLMQPYRLEMGTQMPVGTHKNLYAFWKPKLTKAINASLLKGELFINLASNEYFSAVDAKALKVPVITPEFKDYKDGKLKMISFFAKKARGLMVRYIIDTNAQTLEDLQGFNYEGYQFDSNLSTPLKLVFTR